jgi:hypothetical protein
MAFETQRVLWFFLILFLLVLAGLIIWWFVIIFQPTKRKDLDVKDITARDICSSHNVDVGANLTVGGILRTSLLFSDANFIKPLITDLLEVKVEGDHSFLILTSSLAQPVNVLLPNCSDFPGLQLLCVNQSACSTFTITALGKDTVDSISSIAPTKNAHLISTGYSNWSLI